MDLSIIIVTFNSREIALKTVASYLRAIEADRKHSYEIIVVDNASIDGVAGSIQSKYKSKIKLIRNRENVGFSKANNVGFAKSRGRYILFSNPDIEVDNKTLPTLIKLIDENPQVGVCTPFLRLVATGQIDWGAHRGFPTPWAAFTYFSGLEKTFAGSSFLSKLFGQYHLRDRKLHTQHEVNAIRGGFFFVRREVFEKAGGWDERYFMFGEDIDLCYQIKKLGYKIMFYPQATALHYHGATTGLKSHTQDLAKEDVQAQKRAYHAFYDSMKLFYYKNYKNKYPWLVRQLVFAGIEARRLFGQYQRRV